MSNTENLPATQPDPALIVQGAAAFGVKLRLNDDDELVYHARYEPSESVLERISEHKEAITALLKARRAASTIAWEKLADISADELAR